MIAGFWDMIKRWRWAIAAVAALAAFLAYSFYPETIRVDMDEVSSGPMTVGLTDDGVTRLEDVFVVSAPVSGQVTRIEIEPGDSVAAGKTILARMTGHAPQPLDPRSRAELRSARAAAAAAQRSAAAALALSEQTLARSEALAKRGFLARAGLDAARSDTAARRAAVDQARAEGRRIDALLSQPAASAASSGPVIVRAPSSGVVLRVLSESEGVVAEGTPLVEIGDPSQIEMAIDLLSREAVQVVPGARVEITNWGGESPLSGRVRTVEPFGELKISALGIEEQRVNVIVDFDEESPETSAALARLGHGYQLDARIILWQADQVTRVPIGALFRGADGGWRVYAVEGGRADARRVTLGHVNDTYGEVLSGLRSGEQVIVNPGASIADRVRVAGRGD